MKILVTGSTGFIGSTLCRALVERGHSVRAFHRQASSLRALEGLQIDHVVGELTQPDSLITAMQDIEIVYHLAAQMDSAPAGKQYAVTVEGTRAVVQAALKTGVERLIYTSSAAALGVPETDRPSLLNEDHTWNFSPQRYPYGYAKYLAELEIQKGVAQGLQSVILNPTMVIGPGDLYRQSNSPILMVAQRKLAFAVEGGLNIVHINDVIDGHIAALEHGQTGHRYILGGENMTVLSMLQAAARAAGVPVFNMVIPAWVIRAAAGPATLFSSYINLPVSANQLYLAGKHFYYDIRKAASTFNLPAPRPAEEAIRAALAWSMHK